MPRRAVCKLQESLSDVARAGERSTTEVAKALARHERMMKMVAIGAGAAAVVAIVIAVIGLVG